MRILVLGGTRFLSRASVVEALRRGHDVVSVSRGVSGEPVEGARHVVWDRAHAAPSTLVEAGPYDAVIDVARTPSHVARALDVLAEVPWVFVSTISVYADAADPSGPGEGRLLAPVADDLDPMSSPEVYGAMKVACEDLVRTRASSATIVRPGLIVGRGDPTGRFAYWASRTTREGPVLAPGDPGDAVQVVDVADLAAWLVDLAEAPVVGVLDAVGPVLTMTDLVATCVPRGRPVWIGHDQLAAAGVEPWAGPDSVGLWLPRPAFDGMLAHDPAPAAAAGLRCRPLAATCADVAAWLDDDPHAPVGGIDAEREAAVLARVGAS